MGIDPITSRMLSEHSTIWANSPPEQVFHMEIRPMELTKTHRITNASWEEFQALWRKPWGKKWHVYLLPMCLLLESWLLCSPSRAWIAQSVEHQTFNLRVQGSSPCSGVPLIHEVDAKGVSSQCKKNVLLPVPGGTRLPQSKYCVWLTLENAGIVPIISRMGT